MVTCFTHGERGRWGVGYMGGGGWWSKMPRGGEVWTKIVFFIHELAHQSL